MANPLGYFPAQPQQPTGFVSPGAAAGNAQTLTDPPRTQFSPYPPVAGNFQVPPFYAPASSNGYAGTQFAPQAPVPAIHQAPTYYTPAPGRGTQASPSGPEFGSYAPSRGIPQPPSYTSSPEDGTHASNATFRPLGVSVDSSQHPLTSQRSLSLDELQILQMQQQDQNQPTSPQDDMRRYLSDWSALSAAEKLRYIQNYNDQLHRGEIQLDQSAPNSHTATEVTSQQLSNNSHTDPFNYQHQQSSASLPGERAQVYASQNPLQTTSTFTGHAKQSSQEPGGRSSTHDGSFTTTRPSQPVTTHTYVSNDGPSNLQLSRDLQAQLQALKRKFNAADASSPAPPQPRGKPKRAKYDPAEFTKVRTSNEAAQEFASVVVSQPAIFQVPTYVNEVTSIQAAKDRLARNATNVEYHNLDIQDDDHTRYHHKDLMPVIFQRFLDAILLKPGDPPAHVHEEKREEFVKKHYNRYQKCCSLLESKEQQLDAIAAFEILASSAKRLSTHGIPIADLKVSEYEKPGDKQRIMLKSNVLVDQQSTFLQRVDLCIEQCKSCKWMALDILNNHKTSDIVAAPDGYAKQKFTAFNNNDSRDNRTVENKKIKAEIASLKGESNVDVSDGLSIKKKRKCGKERPWNFSGEDAVGGAAAEDDG